MGYVGYQIYYLFEYKVGISVLQHDHISSIRDSTVQLGPWFRVVECGCTKSGII